MKKLLIIAVLALCLTALVGTAAVGSGGVNSAGASDKDTFVYQMSPPGYVTEYNNLDDLFPTDFDVFFVINMGPGSGSWKMDIEDCCIPGDTMLGLKLGTGGLQYDVATSPDLVHLGPVSLSQYQWVLVITGYIRCPGGFPAGYYWYIWM